MLTYEEIIEKKNETYKLMKDNESKLKDINSYLREYKGSKEEFINKYKLIKQDVLDLETKKADLSLTMQILNNNFQFVVFTDIFPKMLEVWNKYVGKQFGVKTRQKIRNEIKEATGLNFYLMGDKKCNIDTNDIGIEVSIDCKYLNKPFLINNKIQFMVLDDLSLYGVKEYIEDVEGRIKEIRQVHNELLKIRDQFTHLCKVYNELAIGNMHYIFDIHNIYENDF